MATVTNPQSEPAPEKLAEAWRLYLKGDSCAKIGPLFEVSGRTINQWFRDAGYTLRRVGDTVNENGVSTSYLKQLLDEGFTVPEIAKRVGMTTAGIRQRLTKEGIPYKRSRGPAPAYPSVSDEELIRLHVEEERSTAEIERLTGMRHQKVGERLKALGYTLHFGAPQPRRELPPEQIQRLIDGHAKGLSMWELARQEDLSYTLVRSRLQEAGVEMHPHGRNHIGVTLMAANARVAEAKAAVAAAQTELEAARVKLAEAERIKTELETKSATFEKAERVLENIKREEQPETPLRLTLKAILSEEGFKGEELAILVYPDIRDPKSAHGRLRQLTTGRNKQRYQDTLTRVRKMSLDEREEFKKVTANKLRTIVFPQVV